ncbi:hypothetical protein EYZ11_011060 [Aspergillus tanneri]|uniref:Uncharacterized protein n=1 Tax=Aspergillus tanneri TaxID=1220188 RepID=A0A4S3J437_9EURO|nr:hypothetical protein EYZ11_011060 [Aspergillus tanneri]
MQNPRGIRLGQQPWGFARDDRQEDMFGEKGFEEASNGREEGRKKRKNTLNSSYTKRTEPLESEDNPLIQSDPAAAADAAWLDARWSGFSPPR